MDIIGWKMKFESKFGRIKYNRFDKTVEVYSLGKLVMAIGAFHIIIFGVREEVVFKGRLTEGTIF